MPRGKVFYQLSSTSRRLSMPQEALRVNKKCELRVHHAASMSNLDPTTASKLSMRMFQKCGNKKCQSGSLASQSSPRLRCLYQKLRKAQNRLLQATSSASSTSLASQGTTKSERTSTRPVLHQDWMQWSKLGDYSVPIWSRQCLLIYQETDFLWSRVTIDKTSKTGCSLPTMMLLMKLSAI